MNPVISLLFLVFFSSSFGFTYSEAEERLMIAYSTGCDFDNIQQWNCFWCTQKKSPKAKIYDLFYGEKVNFFGFTGVTKDYIFITYRGTVGMENWITDIEGLESSPFHSKIPGAEVHDGFLRAYRSMREPAWQSLFKLADKFPKLPILMVGHSLGGALATLTAAEFSLNGTVKNDIHLWTFGSPRVGNAAFANFVNKRYPDSIRVVNQRDAVPHLPPMVDGFYQHVNTEYWFTSNTTYVKCATTEDPNCSDSVWWYHFKDHVGYLGFNKDESGRFGCH